MRVRNGAARQPRASGKREASCICRLPKRASRTCAWRSSAPSYLSTVTHRVSSTNGGTHLLCGMRFVSKLIGATSSVNSSRPARACQSMLARWPTPAPGGSPGCACGRCRCSSREARRARFHSRACSRVSGRLLGRRRAPQRTWPSLSAGEVGRKRSDRIGTSPYSRRSTLLTLLPALI